MDEAQRHMLVRWSVAGAVKCVGEREVLSCLAMAR